MWILLNVNYVVNFELKIDVIENASKYTRRLIGSIKERFVTYST